MSKFGRPTSASLRASASQPASHMQEETEVATPATLVSRFAFVGDGLHCGDGGLELQRLWLEHPWRPLRGCDGRYVQRGTQLTLPPPLT